MDFKKILIWLGIILFCAAFWYFVINGLLCEKKGLPEKPYTVQDPAVQGRLENEQKTDTVFKFIDRFIYKESKPKIVYEQKVDSITIEKTKDLNLMLGLEKTPGRLRIYAVDQNEGLLKEMWFDDVNNNFSAYSTADGVMIKSRLWNWTGIEASYTHKRPINDLKNKFEHNVDIMTGISFDDKYSLKIGPEYDITNQDLKLKAKATIKLW